MAEDAEKSSYAGSSEMGRRDFLTIGAAGAGAIAGGAALMPFIRSMQPSADVEAQRTVELDISDVKEGEMKVAEWQGKPIFILHRDADMIKLAGANEGGKDKQADTDRAEKPEWLVLVGSCTHLGCIPLWKPHDGEEWQAWHCPCHGSKYDFSGRIIVGPAPKNLEVPAYKFLSDTKLMIGEEKA